MARLKVEIDLDPPKAFNMLADRGTLFDHLRKVGEMAMEVKWAAENVENFRCEKILQFQDTQIACGKVIIER